MKKNLFLLLCALECFFITHTQNNNQTESKQLSIVEQPARKLFIPAKPAQMPKIPTITAGWLDITQGISRFEEILTPLTRMVEDDSIDIIILRIDSAGGSPGDSQIIADYIQIAKIHKPILAFISRIGASGAYWIASACSYILSPASAEIGSIGVLSQYIFDKDKQYHIIASGLFKAPIINQHQELDPKFLEHEKKSAEQMAKIFAEDVSTNRNIPVETILSWEGAIFPGRQALERGLVDQNGTIQDLLEKTVAIVSNLNKDVAYEQLVILSPENEVQKKYAL
ncbi:MAG: S49 family peptidase [Candidatus Babeliaceae bacterium]|nr:S49 family peptidase [Candidatus Babeliaceae bacterium]